MKGPHCTEAWNNFSIVPWQSWLDQVGTRSLPARPGGGADETAENEEEGGLSLLLTFPFPAWHPLACPQPFQASCSNESLLTHHFASHWTLPAPRHKGPAFPGAPEALPRGDRTTCAHSGPSVTPSSPQPCRLQPTRLLCPGFSRREHWSGLPRPPPGDLPDPGIEPMSLMTPALAGRFSTIRATWEALHNYTPFLILIIFHTISSTPVQGILKHDFKKLIPYWRLQSISWNC